MQIINRISKILAILIVYIICAYGYLTAKGFVFEDGVPVLSNQALAKEEFSVKVNGDLMLTNEMMRFKGDDKAPITMYIFSSLMCSHCSDFHRFILPKIEKNFVEKGMVKYVFVHFPLDVLSMQIAKMSYCMPENNYYSFIEELYGKKDWRFAKDDNVLLKYAKQYGLNDGTISACKDNKKLTSSILQVRDNAISKLNIKGTPSFVIETKNGKELIAGSKKYGDFEEYFNNKLKEIK